MVVVARIRRWLVKVGLGNHGAPVRKGLGRGHGIDRVRRIRTVGAQSKARGAVIVAPFLGDAQGDEKLVRKHGVDSPKTAHFGVFKKEKKKK
jgi:hypothetical protein